MFEIGKVYKRKQEVHIPFGGQRQGGISTPSNKPYIFLFTSDAGKEFGYEDGFRPDGIFEYTGEGQNGDMQWQGGNLAIRDQVKNGKTLHLFEYVKKAYVCYWGAATTVGHHWEERPDKNGMQRQAIVFHLALDTEIKTIGGHIQKKSTPPTPNLAKKTLSELRKLAENSPSQQSTRHAQTTIRVRSEAIKIYALKRANGICEGCGSEAPFQTKTGPFLEVHHLHRLGDGGPDHPGNVSALCPNCHRRVHYGIDGMKYNEDLILIIQDIEF